MIQFPDSAAREWGSIAARVEKSITVRAKIEREVLVANKVAEKWVGHEAKLQFDQELAAQDTPPLEMMTLEDFLNNPSASPQDIIDGVVKDGGLTVVLGPSGAGKSTIALQLVHSMLTGQDFLTQQVSMQVTGGVGMISYDMDASMMHNWMSGWSGPGIDHSKISVVNAHRQGNPLSVTAQRQQIVDAWRDAKVEVVVIDSFSASFFGTDQNDAAATMAHYRELKKFALTEVGAKVLILVVHSSPGKATKARGSSVHQDAPDTIVAVEKNEEGYREVKMNKYRTIAGSAITEMPSVTVGAPDPVTNLVAPHLGAMVIKGAKKEDLSEIFPDEYNKPVVSDDQGDESEEENRT